MVDNYGDRGSPVRRLMPLMNVFTSPQLRSKYHGEFVPLQRSGNGGSLLALQGSFPTVMILWKAYDLWAYGLGTNHSKSKGVGG